MAGHIHKMIPGYGVIIYTASGHGLLLLIRYGAITLNNTDLLSIGPLATNLS